MRAFVDLYEALDRTTRTSEKVAAMVRYFRSAPPEDAIWAVFFLSGRKPRQIVRTRGLVEWIVEAASIPEWLLGESFAAVGDMAETMALLLPDAGTGSDLPLHAWIEERLLPLRLATPARRHDEVLRAWRELGVMERYVYNKLITGELRVGVSQKLMMRALAEASGVPEGMIAERLMGEWEPSAAFYRRLTASGELAQERDVGRPYPFFLAHPIEDPAASLDDLREWQAEWKWDGIRAQLIRRAGRTYIWSRGEELVTDRYPEVAIAASRLPNGTVLDGELLPWDEQGGHALPFAALQRRIGRKTIDAPLLAEVPVVFMAFDLLEDGGDDVRGRPLEERRSRLETVLSDAAGDAAIRVSPIIAADDWAALAAARERSRERRVEGIMLKRLGSGYGIGRKRGDWWKWKIGPYTFDGVLIYAEPGHGKRASLYTDYTFGVWDEHGALVPVAKAYSGLTDEEIREVDAFVRANTVQQLGPVRAVRPLLLFEVAFEAIRRSSRHRSGVAVRFPRILRWRKDKPVEEADTLESLRALIPAEGRPLGL